MECGSDRLRKSFENELCLGKKNTPKCWGLSKQICNVQRVIKA